jgi:hypothetical protein
MKIEKKMKSRMNIENENENWTENANSKQGKNTNRKNNKSEANLKRKNNIFKKLTTSEFCQPLARNNTLTKLIATDGRWSISTCGQKSDIQKVKWSARGNWATDWSYGLCARSAFTQRHSCPTPTAAHRSRQATIQCERHLSSWMSASGNATSFTAT